MGTPNIYGLSALPQYASDAGELPGAAAFSAGVLFQLVGNSTAEWGNVAANEGWQIALTNDVLTPGVVLATLSFGILPAATDVVTVPIGTGDAHWLFVSFTVNADALVVYVNGAPAFATTLTSAVTPGTGTCQLNAGVNATVAWAFYTEETLTADEVAGLFLELKLFSGCTIPTVIPLDHVYSAAQSRRPSPQTVTWEDIGTVAGVDLAAAAVANAGLGSVTPGDFAQPVIAALVGPTGP